VANDAIMPESAPELDVPACVAQVLSGDQEAAVVLMHHLNPLVLKLVRAHLPRRSAEEDLVQTVFLKIFSRLGQFSGNVPLEHWVSRVAVNTCLNELDKQRVRPELRWADLSEDEEEVIKNLAHSEENLDSSQNVAARELVGKMLAQLSPEDRLVITQLHLEGRSVDELQQITGWSRTLVKVRAFRARQKMKKHLQTLLKETRP
jgi:RNA polymerase sigma factor (sigma-70 family)